MKHRFAVGSIVRLRDREWVVQPSDDHEIIQLNPLMGNMQEQIAVYYPLLLEEIDSARFPNPTTDQIGDFETSNILFNAARLSFRSGAGPFRSLGHISVRPRPYQFVPLLMALKLEPVRMLIADDVGIGKTIEAGLIARELINRGDAQRLVVLCPPYLCDQWKQELEDKFHIPTVIVRSSTVAQLERQLPSQDVSLFEYFQSLVISIDYAKSPRRRDGFVLHCPDLVIVDEAHTATQSTGRTSSQQRYDLVSELTANPERHILLLTATPHSGIQDTFRSLLGLLNPEFAEWDITEASEKQKREIAKHFVQRRRPDVVNWLGEETPFPHRESRELAYTLSPEYSQLFEDVYDFARELVNSDDSLTGFRRRVRYWTALALLRCVMSSPESATAALDARIDRLQSDTYKGDIEDIQDSVFSSYVYDSPEFEENTVDASPSYISDEGDGILEIPERKKLKQFAKRVELLKQDQDNKLKALIDEVRDMLNRGCQIIIYCRYIATAKYVANNLQSVFKGFTDLRVIAVTGELSEDVRRTLVKEIQLHSHRILVATDCLSEGINLQQGFDSVIHYDLPWNPNRLEQREGRVDRYGQHKDIVETVLIHGRNNYIDGAVLRVLIRKAVEIRKSLGITVPVPIDSESVLEAVLQTLFMHSDRQPQQLSLGGEFNKIGLYAIDDVHKEWDRSAQKQSKTRFAQRMIKPSEISREIEETDHALGSPSDVEQFLLTISQRLNIPMIEEKNGYRLDLDKLQYIFKEEAGLSGKRKIAFYSPVAEGYEYIGRNHPIIARLAEYAIASSLTGDNRITARVSAIRTAIVDRVTNLIMLRVRHRITQNNKQTLAEECVICGFARSADRITWLSTGEAKQLFADSTATNPISKEEISTRYNRLLPLLANQKFLDELDEFVQSRANYLQDSHERIRKSATLRKTHIEGVTPPDILGVYILVPDLGSVSD
jgi:superfamily II DNA or RNA helicase